MKLHSLQDENVFESRKASCPPGGVRTESSGLSHNQQLLLLSLVPTNDHPSTRVPWGYTREKCVSYQLCQHRYTLVCQHSPSPFLARIRFTFFLLLLARASASPRCILLFLCTAFLPDQKHFLLFRKGVSYPFSSLTPHEEVSILRLPHRILVRFVFRVLPLTGRTKGFSKYDLLPSRYRLASWLQGFRGRSRPGHGDELATAD